MPLKIGQVARRTGISVEAIRYYERLGLIREPPRSTSGYRQFGAAVVRRLRFIQRVQALGFSLHEIRELLQLQQSQGAPAAEVRSLMEGKLGEVERKMADLERIRQALLDLSCTCTGTGTVSECPILDALEGRDTTGESPSPERPPRSDASRRR